MPTLVSSVAPAHATAAPPNPFGLDRSWRELVVAPTPIVLVLAAVVAVLGDLAAQADAVGIVAAATVLAAAVALLASGRVEQRTARLVVAAAPVFGLWLAVRTSPWLLPLDGLASVGLLALGATLARGGSLADLPPVAWVGRAVHLVGHTAWAPTMLRLRRRQPDDGAEHADVDADGWPVPARRWVAPARGVLLALPIAAVFTALLASADAVFASLFDLGFRADVLVAHVVGVTVFGWLTLGLLRTASAPAPTDTDGGTAATRRGLGRTEATIVLGAVVVVFAAFVAAQAVAAAGGADHVLETAGLTQAEHARSGFFQLLWVTGLTITGLVTLAHVTDLDGPGRARLRHLVAAVVALSLVIVGVAVVRLDLYRDAYGWTMLRLGCTAVAIWLGAVLVLLGVALTGPAGVRRLGWFVPASLAAGLAILLALNVVNPEALVARHNLTRTATVAVDVDYLEHLSDDALPTIVSLLPELDPVTEQQVRDHLACAATDGEPNGWTAWNLGVSRAEDARRQLCRA